MSTSTTLGAAITTTAQNYVAVASATGFHVGDVLRVDQEAMTVLGIAGLVIHVMRGVHGTTALTHLSGSVAVVGDPRECIFPGGGLPIGSDLTKTPGAVTGATGTITMLVDGAVRYVPLADSHS